MMVKEIISAEQAPAAVGPYSQAVRAGGWLYVSGQIPADPATGELAPGDIGEQTRRVLQNLCAVLDAAGSSPADVVKATVYLNDMNDFAAMNEVFATYFTTDPPARACIEAARLPKDVAIEMDVVAFVG